MPGCPAIVEYPDPTNTMLPATVGPGAMMDPPFAATLLTVSNVRAVSYPPQLAAEPADLGNAHQDDNRRLQPDAVDAGNQVEPFGKIVVLANLLLQHRNLGLLELAKTRDLLLPVRLRAGPGRSPAGSCCRRYPRQFDR